VPEYPGHQARCWINFPQHLLNDVQSGEQTRAVAALSRIVLEHNGWCDEDGAPYPSAAEAEAFWQAIPTHQAACLLRALVERAAKSPLAPARPRR